MSSLSVDKVGIPKTEDELCNIPESVSRDCVFSSVFANLDFRGFSDHAKGLWKRRFSESVVSEIVSLSFWRCIIDDFQPNDTESIRITGLIAVRYRELFEGIPNEWKDKFLSKLPDALAQSVLFSLFLAFPRSRLRFDAPYRIGLLRRFCMLVWGYVPVEVSTSHWKLLLGDGNVLDSIGAVQASEDKPIRIDRFSPLVKQLVYENRFAALRYIPATRMRLTRARSEPKLEYSPPLVDSTQGSFLRELQRLEARVRKESRGERHRLNSRLKSLTRQEAARFSTVLMAK